MSNALKAASRAHTKIVATVGPACRTEPMLADLIDAGVDVFRLNMAHGEMAEHEAVLNTIRKLGRERDTAVAVLVDLAGPKIRLGALHQGVCECPSGGEISFERGVATEKPGVLVSTYDRLLDELEIGNRVMLADGTVSLLVQERSADAVKCRVVQPGAVRNRQGINLPGARVSLPALSEADRMHAAWAATHGVDFVSLSFVRRPHEILELKALLKAQGSGAKVIAKIEKQEAIDLLEEIVSATDGVMVARGDLGVEIDVAKMPVVQKQIVACCHRHYKPVIIATQMLDSMQRSRQPTRAEVTDVANAILDGCDACMLSGETAVGEHPRLAVEMMNRVAVATEPLFRERASLPRPKHLPPELQPITHAVVAGAGQIARELDAKLVVVASHSGATALAVSKQRNSIPTVGVSDCEETLRQMSLYWGVIPLAGPPPTDSIHLLRHVEEWGRKDGCLAYGDHMVLVAGAVASGLGHNMVRVHRVAN